MATIKERIMQLEQQAEINDNVIFFEVHPDDCDDAAQGWFFYRDGVRVDILRLPDEADDVLRVRAAAACRAANCPMVLFEIDPEWVNHYGLIVPMPMTPEEWEVAAGKQQAELCREVTHAKP